MAIAMDSIMMASICYVESRLPVIQALAADVRKTTQSMLSQLLQKLRSNIQVKLMLILFIYLFWFFSLLCFFFLGGVWGLGCLGGEEIWVGVANCTALFLSCCL